MIVGRSEGGTAFMGACDITLGKSAGATTKWAATLGGGVVLYTEAGAVYGTFKGQSVTLDWTAWAQAQAEAAKAAKQKKK
jgi:hypothetical protein